MKRLAGSQATSRVHQIDALRGVAVLMILFVNIFAFAYPLELADQAGLTQPLPFLPQLQHQLYEVLIHGKWISLLTLLFGASLYLLWQQSHRSALRLTVRMSALLLIGFCHAVFIWSGDVLLMYALVALGLIWQQVLYWPVERQLSYAKNYLAAGLIVPALIWLMPSGPAQDPAEITTLLSAYTGPYSEQVGHQIRYLGLIVLDILLTSYWWFGGTMLLAIWAMQSDWRQLLTDHFFALLLLAFGCALVPLLWTGFSVQRQALHPLQLISDLCFSLVYIRLLLLFFSVWPGVYQLLIRCGRCSLSIYLSQSVAMVLLFRWIYPQWFATLDRDTLTAIAVSVILLQLLLVHYFYQPGQAWWCEQLYRWLSVKLERKTRDTA